MKNNENPLLDNKIEIICTLNSDIPLNADLIRVGDLRSILDVEGEFEILINNRIYFNDPYFAFLELLKQIELWDKKSDFYYRSIETDDYPLLAFEKHGDYWVIKSVWNKFEFNGLLKYNQIVEFINDFKCQIENELLVKYNISINNINIKQI